MPSIANGLFAGRAGIASNGAAIAVVGDNIANASTTGFKASRAEFSDIIAGGGTPGRVIGSGSSVTSVSPLIEQGTLENTGRALDLAIDGNGFFVVADGAGRFYTRAGDFKVDSAGYLVNQAGKAVLGYKTSGSGALEPLNVNTVSQESVKTTAVSVAGNLDSTSTVLTNGAADIPVVSTPPAVASTTTYADLNAKAAYSTVLQVFDSLGAAHSLTTFFFHTGTGTFVARTYANSEDVDPTVTTQGIPRQVGTATLSFGTDGTRSPVPSSPDITATIPWNNGSTKTDTIDISFDPFTQFSSAANILSITQDGRGVGVVTGLSIAKNGDVFAQLSNGQSATIGTVALANFASPESLARIGNNLLQESAESGEPIFGKPQAGTLGQIQGGALELSTVDIANEFVKMITLQRGFQANSRIIQTINQLLSEIIQLA